RAFLIGNGTGLHAFSSTAFFRSPKDAPNYRALHRLYCHDLFYAQSMDRQPLDFLVALAPHIRDALLRAFIAFTRTPIELKDANTRAVFGDYIDICDIKQAVDDHATVNIEPLTQPSPHKGARAGERH